MSEQSLCADNVYTWNSLTETKDAALLQGQAEPGMWLRPSLVRALRGNCSRAALLGQLLYWSLQLAQEGQERDDGWFEYSIRQIEFRTGMGKDSIRKHRNALAETGLIEYKDQPTPQPTLFRINLPAVLQLILKHVKMTRKRRAPIGEQARPSIGEQARPSIGEQARPLSYSKNIEESTNAKSRAPEKQTHGKPSSPKGRLPQAEVITSMRLPADFSVSPEMRAWAGRELPPETAARIDELHVCFVRKYRRELPNERRDGLAAWVAKWEAYMGFCASNAAKGQGQHGPAPMEDSSPSYDTLVAAGIIKPDILVASRPAPAVAPMPAYAPGDKCSF